MHIEREVLRGACRQNQDGYEMDARRDERLTGDQIFVSGDGRGNTRTYEERGAGESSILVLVGSRHAVGVPVDCCSVGEQQ